MNDLINLIELCKIGNRKAQKELYYLYYNQMITVVKKYVNDINKVEEILNDGFLRIFQKLHMYEFKGSLLGWMYKIMRNITIDYVLKNKHFIADQKVILVEKENHSFTDPLHKINYSILVRLIEELPKRLCEVFKLYLEGFTHSEIAIQLNIAIDNSKWSVYEAKKILQSQIIKLQLI